MSESYYNGNYTGAEIDAGIAAANAAAPQATTYTKNQVDTALNLKENKAALGGAAYRGVYYDVVRDGTGLVTSDGIYRALNGKVDKIPGKGLSTNDFTNYYKTNSDPETRVEYLYDAAGMTPARMNYTTGQFDYGSWANAWFITGNKPCALKYDGTIDYYLDPDDYTKKADGTASDVSDANYAGNFMASMPTVWVKRWEDARYQYTAIANKQIDDDFKAYAGDGFINDYIYIPMFKGCVDTNGKMRSYAGHEFYTGYTAEQELTALAQCGTGWQGWDLLKWRTLSDLCTLISKSTNSQLAFGRGNTNSYNQSSSTGGIIPTGQNDLTTGQFNGYDDMTHHVKAFHVEDFWGNRSDRCYGAYTVNGVYIYKMHPPYSAEPDGTYINTGIEVPEVGTQGGWISAEHLGDFGLLPSSVDGSSTTYYCDYLWESHEGTRLAAIGGMNNHYTNAGSYFIQFTHATNLLSKWVGSSPLYNPPHSA